MLPSMLPTISVDAVLRGKVAPLGPKGRPSAIHKTAIDTTVAIGTEGLTGDEQADRKHHGGPEKAVHHYPFDHYAYWREQLPHADALKQRGAFGENLSTTGWTETQVCIGDIIRVGTAVLQVSQGRQPCWKLGARFDFKKMPLELQRTRFTGWYYRVLEPGEVKEGDTATHLERPAPDWPLIRAAHIIYDKVQDQGELEAMASLALLSENWRKLAEKRLRSGAIEDWTSRVVGAQSSKAPSTVD